jgi:membrane-bound hydrogenase subunit beta
MKAAEKIKLDLVTQFGFLTDQVHIQRARRIWCEVEQVKFWEVFELAVKKLNFQFIATITGLDEGENLGFIYHLYREDGILLNIHTQIKKDGGVLKSVRNYFPGAVIYEKELIDLFGARIEDLPEGVRYPLPDDWPDKQYPLRKDWDASVLDQKEKK